MRPLLLLVCVCAFLACPPRTGAGPGPGEGKPRIEAKHDSTADDALAAAKATLDSKGKKAAIQAFLSVRKSYPETTAGQEALYRAGVLAFEEGDYVTARKALNELLFENPLHEHATDARLKSGLAALELKAYRDAYQTLSTLVDKLEGPDKQRALEALEKAAAGSQQYGDLLKSALKAVDQAGSDQERADALAKLEETVETRATMLAIAEAWHDLPSAHPAWPLLTFKLARVYYHLRDWPRLDETLRALIAQAPNSPYTPDAKKLLERTARRLEVKPKVVGAVLPMSGKYKALGEAVVRGAQLALRGTDIELVVKDSQGDVNLAGKLVEELAFDNGAIAILGPLLADDSRRAALVAEELQVPIITLTRAQGITQIGPHVFRNMVTNAQQAEALADYTMGTLGYKTFGVMYPNIPFGVEFTNEFWDEIERRGGTIRAAETYTHDQTTFTDEVKKLVGRYYLMDRSDYIEQARDVQHNEALDEYHKRKAMEKLRSNLEPVVDFEALLLPDSWQQVGLVAPALAAQDIITNGCDKKDIEKILKATKKTDARTLKTVTLLGPSTWSSPKDRNGDYELTSPGRGGKYVQCSIYVDGFFEGSNRKATRDFVAAFHEANKEAQPGLLDAVGYDSAGILKQLIEKTGPKSRVELTQRLAALKDYEGATGTTSFDNQREAKRPLFLLSIDPKGIKEINPKTKPPEG